MPRTSLAALALTLAVTTAPTALAQEGGAPNFVAFGVATSPDHPGSDDYRILPFGAGRATLGGVVYQVEGPGISAAFYNEGNIEAGAYVRWYGGRDDDIDDAIVRLLPEQDGAPVIGGFMRVQLAQGVLNEYDRIYVSGRAGADISGEYGDVFWSGSLAYATPLSRTTLFIANVSVSGSGDDYANAMFSIDAAGAAASGLAPYTAEGGIQDVGVTLFLDQQVSDNWSVTGVFGASKLQSDYADSPIVTVRGDDSAYFAGLAIGRRF